MDGRKRYESKVITLRPSLITASLSDEVVVIVQLLSNHV